MARYKFTSQDCRKGGIRRAETTDMHELGRRGLQGLANNHFDGNIKKAGHALSLIGNAITDPFPLNGAWQDPIFRLPESLFAKVFGHCEVDDGAPF